MPDGQGTKEPTIALDGIIQDQLSKLATVLGQAAAYALVAAGVKDLPDDTKWPEDVAFVRFAGPMRPSDVDLFRRDAFREIRSDFANFAAQSALLWMVGALEECAAILLMVVQLARKQRRGAIKTYTHNRVVRETLDRVRRSSPIGLLHQIYDVRDRGAVRQGAANEQAVPREARGHQPGAGLRRPPARVGRARVRP